MQAELDRLDMSAIFIVSAGDDWHKLTSGTNPRNAYTNTRRENAAVRGVPVALWVQNEVVAERIISQTLKRLELDGVRTDRRWVGCDAAHVQKVVLALATWLGCKVLTDDERLAEGKRRADAAAQRAGA